MRRGGLRGKPLSAETVKTFHRVVHSALEDAVRNRLLPTNPATRARVPRYDRTGRGDFQVRTWTVEQLASFLEFADADNMGDMWRVAAFTGLGRSEILGLTWSRIDFAASRIDASQALTSDHDGNFSLKSSSRIPRIIAMGEQTAAILHARHRTYSTRHRGSTTGGRNELGLVFTTDSGSPIHPDHVTYRFRTLVRSCGLPHLRFQDLRNTHVAVLLRAGAPFHLVMQRIGIADPWTAMRRYGQHIPPTDSTAAETFERLLTHGATDEIPPG